MDNIIYMSTHEIPLLTKIANYFYLTGISAASFIISSLAYVFGMEKYKDCGKISAIIAFGGICIAPIFLIMDLMKIPRMFYLFFMFNFESPLTWGTIILSLYILNCFLYLYYIFKENKKNLKLFGIIGIMLAISLEAYTGFVLALGKGIALWNTPLMPIYFLISAMVSGTALLIIIVVIKEKFFTNFEIINKIFPQIQNEVIYDLGKMLAVFIAIDLFIAFSDVILLFYSTPENSIVARVLLKGPFNIMFLFGEILFGMVIPFFIFILPKFNKNIALLTFASFLILIGVWFMRYVTVVGGQYVPLM